MDGFKADFIQYLRDNNLLTKVDLNKDDTNINIQKYDDKFTDFLKDYQVDENELIEASIDIDEILSMDFNDIANVDIADNDTNGGKDVIGGLFNFLINQNDIKAQVDKNGDGMFGKDEITEFAKTIASKDGDDSNFTLKDMLTSYQQMNDKEFKVGDFTPVDGGFLGDNGTNIFNKDGVITPTNVATILPSEIEEKEQQELCTMRNDENAKLTDAKQNMEAALNGLDASIFPSQADVSSAYNNYLDLVQANDSEEKQFASRLEEKNGQIASKENELNTAKLQNENDNLVCLELDAEIETLKLSVAGLEEEYNSAVSAQNSIPKLSQNATEQEKASYNSKVQSAQQAVDNAKAKLESEQDRLKEKEDEYKVATENYNTSLEQVNTLTSELETLNSELILLQNEIATTSANNQAELTNLANIWNQTKANHESSKQNVYNQYATQAQVAASNMGVIDGVLTGK